MDISTKSPFSAAFDHDPEYSLSLLDGIDLTNMNSKNSIHDQAWNFPASPSSLLHVSPGDLTPSDLATDPVLGTWIAGTHSNDNSSTTFFERVRSHSGGPGDAKRVSVGDSITLTSTSGNGATSTSSGPGDKPDGGWQNPLHIAAAKGHDRIARMLLQHSSDCNERDSDGLTPLIHATIGGYEDVVRSLLSHGATVAIIDTQHRRSALHWAIVHRRETVLEILLDWCVTHQASIDIYDEGGRTPLHMAADTGYDAGVQLLLQLGANTRCRTRKRKPSS